MSQLIRSYQNMKVADYLRKEKPAKVVLIFWHGLGDLVMFMPCFNHLKSMFPDIEIDIALQKGVGQEVLMGGALLIQNANQAIDGYDYTFQIHFPMSESLGGLWTKQEWCCIQELGVDPISYYPTLPKYQSKLVALHFQATALPDPINPDEATAKKIWGEVIQAGFIPIEALFKHCYFNPVNKKFDFITSHCRDVPATIEKLISLLQSCAASICVASGNLPLSISIMPDRTLYLEKEFSIKSYTKENIATVDVKNYKEGSVKEWLMNIV